MNMDHNDDPPHGALHNPRPFPEPILKAVVRISCDVRSRDGEISLRSNCVLVKNGYSTTFSRAGGLVNADDNYVDDHIIDSSSDDYSEDQRESENKDILTAYLICEELRSAIHGVVYRGIVLRRSSADDVWQITTEQCAIKEMPWLRIRNGQGMAENPRDEVAAMQHFQQFFDGVRGQPVSASTAMLDTKIIMPLNFLYDDRNLYTITPFCEGGELFELLGLRARFTEGESRALLTNILDGLEWLQRAGLCHRDISLENIMIYQGRAVIIDMGMCLKIPYLNDEDGANVDHRGRLAQRCTIDREPRAGKLKYMSPEIYSERPFDGHAVDMWCVGVCLYTMLTGRHPWNQAAPHDYYFRHISGGYLVPILRQYFRDDLSPDAIDLLQRMLFLDPADRISLQQVRDHPWMNVPADIHPVNN